MQEFSLYWYHSWSICLRWLLGKQITYRWIKFSDHIDNSKTLGNTIAWINDLCRSEEVVHKSASLSLKCNLGPTQENTIMPTGATKLVYCLFIVLYIVRSITFLEPFLCAA